jgi:hypothetical protein
MYLPITGRLFTEKMFIRRLFFRNRLASVENHLGEWVYESSPQHFPWWVRRALLNRQDAQLSKGLDGRSQGKLS